MAKQLKKIKVKKPKKPRQPRRAGVPRKPPVTNISVTIAGGSTQPSGSYYFPDAQQQPLNSNVFTQAPAQTFRPRVLEEPVDFIPPPIREVVQMATQTAAPRKFGMATQTAAPRKVEMTTQTAAPRKFGMATQTFIEEAALQPFDIIPPPISEVVEMGTQTAPRRPRLRVVTDSESQTQASVPSNIMPLLPPLPAATGAVAGGGRGRGRPANEFTTSNKSIAQLREMADTFGIDSTGKPLKSLKSEIDYLRRKKDK